MPKAKAQAPKTTTGTSKAISQATQKSSKNVAAKAPAGKKVVAAPPIKEASKQIKKGAKATPASKENNPPTFDK